MIKITLGVLALISSGSAWAADIVDTAKVVSSTPIYERISEPKQECWNETVSSSGRTSRSAPVEDRSMGGAIVGGVVGGVLGHQVGKGSGNTAATVAGAIAGTLIGDHVANNPANAEGRTTTAPQAREERHCRQIENYREVIRGYNVTYRYKGQEATTKLPYQPGDTVRVGITLLEDNNTSDVRDYRTSDNKEHRRKERRHDD